MGGVGRGLRRARLLPPRRHRSSCCRPPSRRPRSRGRRRGRRDGDAGRPSRDARGATQSLGVAVALAVAFVFYSSFLRYPAGLARVVPGVRHLRRARHRRRGRTRSRWTTTCACWRSRRRAASSGPRASCWCSRCAGHRSRRPDVARRAVGLLAALHRALLAHHASSPSPASATRRRGTCCRSTSASWCWRASGRRRSIECAELAPWRGSFVVVLLAGGRRSSRLAELARELPVSGGPAQPVRLRPDESRISCGSRQRIADVAALHPDRAQMLVKVIAGPYEQWPLPWYLRRMHAGRLLEPRGGGGHAR